MNLHTYSKPGEGDPRTIQPDGDSPLKGLPWVSSAPTTLAAPPTYREMKCFKGPNKEFVGHLSNRLSNSVAIGTGPDYPPAMCYWFEKDGALYLATKTDPYDRCLGLGDFGYASWALQQARNMGYFTNLIRNPDGTISPGIYPNTFLAGPYDSVGINWVWWAPKGHPDILVCELAM